MSEYSKKFKDPRWQKKRLEVFDRDRWTCQRCLSAEETLNVHHKYYLKGADPWEYSMKALITLCESCHEEEREAMPIYERNLIGALREKFLSDGIACLADGFLRMPLIFQPDVIASVFKWALQNKEIQKMLTEMYFKSLSNNDKPTT